MRLGRLGYRNPIIALIAVLVTLQLLIMAAGVGGIATVEAVRGFVVGEAQYTKAQQRATSALRRYVRSGDPSDLARYRGDMAVPRSIGLARIVLETAGIPDDHAHALLVAGNIHPDDVPYLITLYKLASGTGFLEPATTAWREGDRLIQQLDALALEIAALRQGLTAADIGGARQLAWLDRIDAYDSALTHHEDTFARWMGEATRTVRGTLISGIIGGTVLLATVGVLTGWRTIRTIDQSERSLIEGRRRFRDVAECAADWFWETDADHRFVYLSNRLREVLGLEPERYIGLTRAQANDGAETDHKWQQLHRIMDERLPFREFEYDHFDGDRARRVRISGKPFFDLEGRFCGYRGAGRDVTAARDAAAKLEAAKETAEAASRSKSEFLANMSHELRTPLNAIIGFSEVMRDRLLGPLNVRYADYAGDINRSGQHLLQVINDILDLSRIEAGHLTLERTQVDLHAETRNVVRLLAETAVAAGVEISNQVDDGLPEAFVDPKRLRQILLNLVGNAVKFSAAGDRVTIQADVRGGLVTLRVSDTGVGIPEDQLSKVLEPFGQADQSLSRPHDGVGLGLALVQRFAHLHGGSLAIASRVGEGTTVTVTLVSQLDGREGSLPKARRACLS